MTPGNQRPVNCFVCEQVKNRFRDMRGRSGIEKYSGVTHDFRQCSRSRTNDRSAGCHRLQRRQAETFIDGREDQHFRFAVQLPQQHVIKLHFRKKDSIFNIAVFQQLLMAFAEHPQRVMTRNQLLDLARGRDATPFDRSIDVQVSRIRRNWRAAFRWRW